MIRVKISLTYRAVPFDIEIEVSDETDVNYLLGEDFGSLIDAVHRFIDDYFKSQQEG